MQRIALGIEYQGTLYAGWQRQRHQPSVQETLEKCISKVAQAPLRVTCAGRTDARVHACGQVVHFNTPNIRALIAWVRGVNMYLPPDIRVLWAKEVSDDFDARFSALSRRYGYVIANTPVKPGLWAQGVTWVLADLNIEAMQEAITHLLGQHDFSTFRSSECQAKTPIRTITHFNLIQRHERLILEVTANAFLHHMIRNIVGSLLWVGKGKRPPEWIKEILHLKNRIFAGPMAPGEGLYLVEVTYPTNFNLPEKVHTPWFLV